MKLSGIGIFTPWKLVNAKTQDFPLLANWLLVFVSTPGGKDVEHECGDGNWQATFWSHD